MAKKQMSFAEKALKHKGHKDWKTIKYVKSERSTKTGSWRFNEKFIQLATNENIDQALSRMEEEVKQLAKEMITIEDSKVPEAKSKEKVEKKDESVEVAESDTSAEVKADTPEQPAQEA